MGIVDNNLPVPEPSKATRTRVSFSDGVGERHHNELFAMSSNLIHPKTMRIKPMATPIHRSKGKHVG